MLVVTGSTGHVGHEQRLIIRDPTRAPAVAGAVPVAGVVAHLAERMPLHQG